MPSYFLTRVLRALADGGSRPAFVHGGECVTYEAATRLVRRLHDGLAAEGVGRGETVAIIGGNRPESLLAQLAAQLRGATVLLVGASASLPDMATAISAAGAGTVIVDPGRIGDLRHLPGRCGVLGLGSAPGVVDLLHEWPTTALALPESARVIFTSGGTTGTPKLICHSRIYEEMAHIFRPGPSPERALLVAPMSHMTGNAAALGALLRGDVVVLHEGFDAAAVLRAIESERITTLSLTPPRLAQVLDHPAIESTDLRSMRALSVGASPLPAHRLRQALDVFGPVVGQGYGLTEAPMIANLAPAELADHPHRLGSVGRIVPGMEARVDDSTGEVLVRGLALMDGYLDRPAPLEDGWLRTGDAGKFDSDGYLYLLGRLDDVIVTGENGSLVHPSVVEDALTGHPLVRHAAVFGVPGTDAGGEVVHAVVVPTEPRSGTPETADALRRHVEVVLGRGHLAPSAVEFTEALPLTPIGKVDRKALRARHQPTGPPRNSSTSSGVS
ncbi:Acyl-CoA synthetase (AMP-forming)/AMP-acid ligase II [Amycolatopsis marina]|uniref:Acyl-CoA synthetase (AMP-forming)/AMP-acid ligase II n=1 Tax=Amycolatopsis marina TaxID=490629 RepID=A0A1I1A945_9PSEU|nr:AMP-binding protein [Amycolatopsis marina]SFB34052.1 Acyl-CoA synthetase (AMP-forming)/AMP-acid ligase II [Amycolatopsis marina]